MILSFRKFLLTSSHSSPRILDRLELRHVTMERERNTDGAGLKLAVNLFNSIKEGMVMCLLLFYITYFFLIFYICV